MEIVNHHKNEKIFKGCCKEDIDKGFTDTVIWILKVGNGIDRIRSNTVNLKLDYCTLEFKLKRSMYIFKRLEDPKKVVNKW